MFPKAVTGSFRDRKTPFYYYDLNLLRETLEQVKRTGSSRGYHIHFALKANHQQRILEIIKDHGLGADCVSGGEVAQALRSGFDPKDVVFAGVGKSDEEIELGLAEGIDCFNVESKQELSVINELAGKHHKTARVALRLNPNVNADTHRYITTGLKENKFGINEEDLDGVLDLIPELKSIDLVGIHFHIGSQIQSLDPFRKLCKRANELSDYIESKGFKLTIINVGGGYGIDYEAPNENPIPDFEHFFALFEEHIQLKDYQELHFELGRAIVGQCGSLITKVLYTKSGRVKNFAIVDAGMTELIRPALYQAEHSIEVLDPINETDKYDVVGPVCESSDTFRTDIEIPRVERGDLIAIRSAGAYGEVMRSGYNLREAFPSLYSDDIRS